MHTITLDRDLENQLVDLAKTTGKPVGECLKEAVQQYLEDRLDYLAGVNAVARKESTIPLAELEKHLGMES
ncbi:MAG: ribbon-helix-helix protein, CopG family [Magnetococcales bacterium]|nr:ribbon-helix-helix protein, CopG family [Magnetococcales bacterium]